ncbi:unnamed protein product [Durusdinium trenchii]|uniref:C-type lectin domain-containing protein n=1 Tax=Durusdinium trenchii TaxID=1381693 RepID=A0ABP0N5M6_9DINO
MNFNVEEYKRKEPLNWASGRWYDVRGSLKLPKAICEKKKTAGVCDTGWSARENSCYLKLTWHYDFETAMLRCEDMGADLVSIGTLKEQIFVQHLCGQQMCWLGLLEHPQSEYWFWIDGTPMAYQNWQTGEPNNGKGDENRAVMNMSPDGMRVCEGVGIERAPISTQRTRKIDQGIHWSGHPRIFSDPHTQVTSSRCRVHCTSCQWMTMIPLNWVQVCATRSLQLLYILSACQYWC